MVSQLTFEIVAAPKDGTTGANLITTLTALDMGERAKTVVVADVECNGNRTWVDQPPFDTAIAELIRYASAVGQFDWGSFFFFRHLPPVTIAAKDYAWLFAAADLVVRAVDDMYFYVYSPSVDDVAKVARFFPVECNERQRDDIAHPF